MGLAVLASLLRALRARPVTAVGQAYRLGAQLLAGLTSGTGVAAR